MTYITIWLIFGLLGSLIARNKGNSSFGGFLLGLILGPIGLIIVLLSSNDKTISNSIVKCPYCAEYVKTEAIVCKHCGREISGRIEIKNNINPLVFEYDQKTEIRPWQHWVVILLIIIAITLIFWGKWQKKQNIKTNDVTQIENKTVDTKSYQLMIQAFKKYEAKGTKIDTATLMSNFRKIATTSSNSAYDFACEVYYKATIEKTTVIKNIEKPRKSVKSSASDVTKIYSKLYQQLITFKTTSDFKLYGLGKGGPYNSWSIEVNELNNHPNANQLISKGLVISELDQLAREYVTTNGKENEYTLFIRKEIEGALNK